MNDIERLFSSIVLVGLATGCGGSIKAGQDDEGAGQAGSGGADSGAGGAGAGTGGSGAVLSGGASTGGFGSGSAAGTGGLLLEADGVRPESCESFAQFHCDEDRCFCDPDAPTSAMDCESPTTFACESFYCGEGGICFNPDPEGSRNNMSCSCDPSRPTGPDDCDAPEDFFCAASGGWECACDPSAPNEPADCEDPVTFSCDGLDPRVGCSCTGVSTAALEACEAAGGTPECQSWEPRFGCSCHIFAIK